MPTVHEHPVRIYYEDTDLSGVVYHSNYLKYFERAREHVIDPDELVRLWDEEGIGFVVYKCEMTFREGARLGDVVTIRTTVSAESEYRAVFQQNVHKPGRDGPMVEGRVELVCVNQHQQLVPLPRSVMARLR